VRRWLGPVAILVLAVTVAYGAYLAWRLVRARAALRGAVEEIRRRGEPIGWAELASAPKPAAGNAAEFHKQAVRTHRRRFRTDGLGARDARRAALLDVLRDDVVVCPALRERHAGDIREILSLSQGVLWYCRRARRYKQTDWPVGSAARAREELGDQRRELSDVVSLLCLAALAADATGDALEAIERLRDAMALARSIESVPSLEAFELAAWTAQAVCLVVEEIAPHLPAGAGQAAIGPATRGLIDDLFRNDRFERALLGERCAVHDLAERVRSGDVPVRVLPRWPRGRGVRESLGALRLAEVFPAFYAADEAKLLRTLSGEIAAARARTYPAALAARPTRAAPGGATSLSVLLLPRLNRRLRVRYRVLAMRRMAATALAIGLHRRSGRLPPQRLAALVPAQLPFVPADPFAAGGATIRHTRGAGRWLLYSVFKNGRDDGGRYAIGSRGAVDLVDSPDLVFFLDARRPAPSPGGRLPSSRRAVSERSGSTP